MNKLPKENKKSSPDFSQRLVDDVRKEMKASGCVFDFTVRVVEPDESVPSEIQHREVLDTLFREIRERNEVDCKLEFDLTHARPTRWGSDQIVDPRPFVPGAYASSIKPFASVTDFEWLFQSFDNPPYRAMCRQGLFADFCEVVGLDADQEIDVLDWVGNCDAEPERSTWSNYFDAGKEWWGIWCLTVWNPRKRTISALAASSTD
ncbi:hypothetical protein [Hydrogenophaga flava]|uniref:hypothetical protein n=1 Tax=Hydrogenophaga flava TaxID=65657 RepID=UPI000AE790BD|nr:hypothetical protein [Hydrogenophaga flava]